MLSLNRVLVTDFSAGEQETLSVDLELECPLEISPLELETYF